MSQKASKKVDYTLTMDKHDLVKLKAFAEAYGLDEAMITEGQLRRLLTTIVQAFRHLRPADADADADAGVRVTGLHNCVGLISHLQSR